jgi:alanine dehydrogenase
MDGTYITGLRTGAASAIATKYLARKNAKTLGVIGAGYQSIFQIAAITKVRDIRDIFVFDIKEGQVEKLAKILSTENITIKKASSIEQTASQDILVTITPVREPIIESEWIKPGIHINGMGADAEDKQELESEILKRAKIVIDNWTQASHSGEINVPLKKGIISKEKIHAELGEIVAGKKTGRETEEEITFFDSTGLAIQDLFTANFVFQQAKDSGEQIKII